MPDKHIIEVWRTPVRVSRTSSYLFMVAAGIAAVTLTPQTIAREAGYLVTLGWGAAVLTGALVAAAGVALVRYRWEWVAIWPVIGGVLAYMATLWGLVAQGEFTRTAQACLITALALTMVTRALELAAHAHKLRRTHERWADSV